MEVALNGSPDETDQMSACDEERTHLLAGDLLSPLFAFDEQLTRSQFVKVFSACLTAANVASRTKSEKPIWRRRHSSSIIAKWTSVRRNDFMSVLFRQFFVNDTVSPEMIMGYLLRRISLGLGRDGIANRTGVLIHRARM